MPYFLIVAFGLLALLFWVASGGDAFEPPERTARAEPEASAPVVVPALPGPAPLTQIAAEEPEIREVDIAAFDRAIAAAEEAIAPPPVAPAAPARDASIEAALGEALDLRTVTGSVVNMRGGPGTGFDVVGQLVEGQGAEVLQEDGDWAEVRTEDGATGWMASRFLR